MSDASSFKARPLLLSLCLGVIGLAVFAAMREEPPSSPSPSSATAPRSAGAPSSPATPDVLTDGVALPPEPDLGASFDAFLEQLPVKPFPRPAEVLEEARTNPQELGPIDYRLKLEKSLGYDGGPAEGVRLLVGMKADSDVMRFQTALALSKKLDAEATRLLLDEVRTADPAVRPHLVFALRGSPDSEVNQTFVELYANDPDVAVRAQAAFAIGERGDRIDALALERARQRARQDFRSGDPQTLKAATDVLGAPPLEASDRQMLEGVLRSDPSSPRRLAALQALATAKVPPAELAPLLERVSQDPTASQELRGLAKQVVEALRAPPSAQEGGD